MMRETEEFDPSDEGPSEEDLARFGRETTGTCYECGAVLYEDAGVCPKCGAFQIHEGGPRGRMFFKRRWVVMVVAALLAIMWWMCDSNFWF